MFNTTPPDSPRAQSPYHSDVAVGSSTEEESVPASTSALLPAMSTREPGTASDEESAIATADCAKPEPEHSDPRMRVRAGEGTGAISEAQRDDEHHATSRDDAATGSKPASRDPHKQLARQERVLNLKEKQLHLEFDRILQEEEDEFDADIRTAQDMAALASWLEAGPPVKVFRLTCDFGGMHQARADASEDSEEGATDPKYEKLDEQLFDRVLAACRGIEVMDLSECRLSSANYSMLRRYLMRKDCTLDCLLLGRQIIGEKEAARLATGLERNRSVTMLSLSGTSIASSNLRKILGGVIRNPRIDSLWLEDVYGSEAQLSTLRLLLVADHCAYLGVQHPTGVTMIGRDTRFWNTLFEQFCNQLSVCGSLRLLDLSGFDLTDENFKSLVDALKHNRDLEWLELGANKPDSKQSALIKSCLLRNRAARRMALIPPARAALDLLAGAAITDGWPGELSDVIVAGMGNATLEQMKKGIDAGFPKPRPKRGAKASSASAPSPTTTAATAPGARNTTDARAREKRGE